MVWERAKLLSSVKAQHLLLACEEESAQINDRHATKIFIYFFKLTLILKRHGNHAQWVPEWWTWKYKDGTPRLMWTKKKWLPEQSEYNSPFSSVSSWRLKGPVRFDVFCLHNATPLSAPWVAVVVPRKVVAPFRIPIPWPWERARTQGGAATFLRFGFNYINK